MSEHEPNLSKHPRLRLTGTIVGSVLGMIVFAVVVLVVIVRGDSRPADDAAERLARGREQLAELRANDARLLSTYGWVDRSKGTVRIPIEVAIERLVASGGKLPASQPAR